MYAESFPCESFSLPRFRANGTSAGGSQIGPNALCVPPDETWKFLHSTTMAAGFVASSVREDLQIVRGLLDPWLVRPCRLSREE